MCARCSGFCLLASAEIFLPELIAQRGTKALLSLCGDELQGVTAAFVCVCAYCMRESGKLCPGNLYSQVLIWSTGCRNNVSDLARIRKCVCVAVYRLHMLEEQCLILISAINQRQNVVWLCGL